MWIGVFWSESDSIPFKRTTSKEPFCQRKCLQHLSRAKKLDRFKGRKDVLTHSLHVACAAEDFPYAGYWLRKAYAALTRRWRWLMQIRMTARYLTIHDGFLLEHNLIRTHDFFYGKPQRFKPNLSSISVTWFLHILTVKVSFSNYYLLYLIIRNYCIVINFVTFSIFISFSLIPDCIRSKPQALTAGSG